MFTGIIETTGIVRSVRPVAAGARLSIDVGRLSLAPSPGASVAVNGVCLTVAGGSFPVLEFDVVPETLRRTTIPGWQGGKVVNLERSLRPQDRIEGHIVQGHVDGVAEVTRVVTGAAGWLVRFRLEDEALLDYLVPKGSIAVDGASLTLVEVAPGARFEVALVPATLERTALGRLVPGDHVNVETDILARTVVAHLRRMGGFPERRVTREFLREHGFA